MKITKGKISMRQFFIIFILAIVSPMIRILPAYTSNVAKQAAWLTPIIAGIGFVLLIFVLNQLFKKHPNKGLAEIIELVFGKIFGKIIIIIYTLWIFIILAGLVRFFAERFLASILQYSTIGFFIVAIMSLTYLVIRNNIEFFARTVEILFILFLFGFIFTFLTLIPEVKLQNLYPITTYDVMPVLKSTLSIVAIFGYIILFMFIGDKVSHKNTISKYGIHTVWLIIVIGVIIIINTVGIFGYELIDKFSLPYFITLKNIEIFDTAERLEAIFISFWVVNDFVIITIFMYVLMHLIKKIFNLKNEKILITPITLLIYVFAFFIADTKFELQVFSDEVAFKVNLVLCIIIPIILLLVGKIRKKL